MSQKARKTKPAPAPAAPIEWPRADPAALAKFDPASKVCTMNCGQHGQDPRSRAELKFMCDDCDIRPTPKAAAPVCNWISCADRLPECLHECTTDDAMVSHTVLVTDERDPSSLGLAHMRSDGTWKLYGGDYDFMHPEQVTHWQPVPRPVAWARPKICPAN